MKLSELESLAEKAAKETVNVEIYGEQNTVNLLWQLTVHRQEIINLVKAAKKQAAHRQCEDTWYSCPKSEEGCADERQGSECNCGADELIAAIAAFEDK